jgi:DNA-binding transcriptional regulator YhcF (GntR family)
MKKELDPKATIPLYHQLAELVERRISAGLLRYGERLPSVRKFAEEMKVSQQTVLKAYEVLEEKGLIRSEKGRGAFVNVKLDLAREERKELENVARTAMIKAIKLGFRPEDLISTIDGLVERGFELKEVSEEPPSPPPEQPPERAAKVLAPISSHDNLERDEKRKLEQLAFVECSLEQSVDIAKEITKHMAGINVVPVVLEILRQNTERILSYFKPDAVFVTTPFHEEELKSFLGGSKIRVFVVDIKMTREFLSALKRLNEMPYVGIIARDESNLKSATGFARAYVKGTKTKIIPALTNDTKTVNEIISKVQMVIHTPSSRDFAQVKLPWGIEKVETTFVPEEESIRKLKDFLGMI